METAVKRLFILAILIVFLVGTISIISAPSGDDGAKSQRRGGQIREICDQGTHIIITNHNSAEIDPENVSALCDYVEKNPEEAEENILDSHFADLFIRIQTIMEEAREALRQRDIVVVQTCYENSGCSNREGYGCFFEDSSLPTGYRMSEVSYNGDSLDFVPLDAPNNGEGDVSPPPRVGDFCTSNNDCVGPDDSLDCNFTTHKCAYAPGFGPDDGSDGEDSSQETSKIKLNSAVEVIFDGADIKDGPSGFHNTLGNQNLGVKGFVISASQSDTLGHEWWNVNFNTGIDGWIVENFIKRASGVCKPLANSNDSGNGGGETDTTTYQCGDVNKDGKIDQQDIDGDDGIVNYIFGGQTPPNSNWDIVDLDGNGIVDSVDVVTIVNYVKRQGPMPPCESDVVCDRNRCSGKRYAASKYACGNINMDDKIDLTDTYLLGRVVFEGAQPAGWDSVDLNRDNVVDVLDVVTLTNYIYRDGTLEPSCSYVFDCGDVNKDRRIDQGDLDKIQDYAFGGQEVPVGVNADLNGDGVIDVVDVAIMVDVAKRKLNNPSCIATTTCQGDSCDRTFNAIVEECGNINRDSRIDSVDINKLVDYAFNGVPVPSNIKADLNGDGVVDITDVVTLVNYVKRNGEKPVCPTMACLPAPREVICSNKQCGTFSAGCEVEYNCGTCSSDKTCNTATGQCQVTCTPNCNGKQCGDNGCVGSCGTCPGGMECLSNQCPIIEPDEVPVINTFSLEGSGIVEAYTTRIWNIKATDPQGQPIKAKIHWGDYSGTSSIEVTKNSGETFNLQHEYPYYTNAAWNTHNIVLTVTDLQGIVTTRNMDVNVHYATGGDSGTPAEIAITSPTAGTYKIGDVMNIIWTAPSTVQTVNIYGMKKLSTGAWDSNLIASNVPSSGGGQYNYLLGTPGTNIQVIGKDSATGKYLSDMSDAFTISTSSSSDFAVGGKVKSFHPKAVWINVFSDVVGSQALNNKMPVWVEGTIKTGSPKFFESDVYRGEGWYWNIDFTSGTDGWVSEKQLISKAKSADIVGYFAKGGRVKVIAESYPRVTPNGYNNYYDFEGNYIQQPQGQQFTAYYKNIGTIVDDAQESGGKIWLKVDFNTGTDGWMDRSVLVTTEDDGTVIPFAFSVDSLINPSTVYVGESNIWVLKGNVPAASASGCTGSQGVLYEVDFGDGTKTKYLDNCLGGIMGYAGESAMKHTYATNGTFNIIGKATSNITGWNGTATKTLRVSVSPKP